MRCQFVGQLLVYAGVVQDAVRAVVQSRVLFVPNMSQHNAAAHWLRLAASGSVGAKLANGWVRDPPVCWTGRVVGCRLTSEPEISRTQKPLLTFINRRTPAEQERVPGDARTRFECDASSGHTRRVARLK